MTEPADTAGTVNPFAPDTTPIARVEPDDTDDTPDGAWRWSIVQAGTGAVLNFGGSCPTEDEARAAADAALAEHT